MEVGETDEQVKGGSVMPNESSEVVADSSKKSGGRNNEAQTLRARIAELEELMAAARADLIAARERREFMREEVEQARDYGEKLTHEMERLQRLQQTLYPDQRASLEVLRRLVATLAELEAQEKSAREDSLAREANLRQEIAEFKGETRSRGSLFEFEEDASEATTGEAARAKRPVREDPLAEEDREGARGGAGGKDGELHGNVLLSEGLLRIEAAHKAASAERDVMATRLSRLRLAVARRQREEDATPGHAELLQYLSRFDELGLHAQERDKQLRRCQTERSVLALTRETLAEESRLLETVAGGVEEASKQKNAREAFLRQFDGMIEGVQNSLANQKRVLGSILERQQATEETQEAMSAERKRFLAGTRELNEACFRYEGLVAKFALMGRPVV